MPLITGLYAASFACMVGALLGRCGQLQTGPVAMTSLLSAAAVGSVATGPEDYLSFNGDFGYFSWFSTNYSGAF